MRDYLFRDTCFSDLSVRVADVSSPQTHLLDDCAIHVWFADLRDFRRYKTLFKTILSKDERERAAKFHFPSDGERHLLSRGILRFLLSRFVARLPAELKFLYGTRGKPELAGNFCKVPIHFNISHSADCALFGITRACPIGVDMEHLLSMEFMGIATSFFSPQEVDSLKTLPTDRQMTRFLALWACKEALMKATGEGLSDNLKRLRVIFTHTDVPMCSYPPLGPYREEWQLRIVHPAPDYVGAVAFRQTGLDVITRRLRA